ncbi:MAG: phosphotransferase family protein [Pseudonocardia sp.]
MVRDLGTFPRPVLTALSAAERLLTRRAGATVVLADPEDLGGSDRSVVARARVARNPFSLPRSLVVKQYLDEPLPDRPDPFRSEVASCQLFTALPADVRPSPVIIAHDPQARLLVMEDLGRSSTLADKLFGPDPAAARHCLLGWARGLGRMQAATAARENDFGALLRRLGERSWRDPMAAEARAALAGVPELLAEDLGVHVPAAAAREAHETARLLGGTRYRAFSPSDTCPDNNLVTSRGVRFVDFEWGCFRDVALDAAYFSVPFPACAASFALPPEMADALLAAWRNEITVVWPDLDEPELLERRLLSARLLWVWLCTWWLLPRIEDRDSSIGPDATRSPRISTALAHYWSHAADTADRAGRGASADLGRAVAGALRERFPDAPRVLPVFPAFRSVE